MAIHAVIMAGGSGTRFWPMSRKDNPKQLLNLAGDRTMIQATVDRLRLISDHKHILIVTGQSHVAKVQEQLPEIPAENIIAEPCGRNTAPCVALAAAIVKKRDPGGVMAIFPADHVIARPDALADAAGLLIKRIEKEPHLLGIVGIAPNYPETGYGYIKTGPEQEGLSAVEAFCEKPDEETARSYLEEGGYLWNAGMFFWRADTILEKIAAHMPALTAAMAPIVEAVGTDRFDEVMAECYPGLPGESIDFGVMEKAGKSGDVVVAACEPGWNDVGSWRSVYDLSDADSAGNRARGDLIAIDSTGVVAETGEKLVAVVGVNDIIVVETDDALLICHKDRAQEVREVTKKLEEKGRGDLL